MLVSVPGKKVRGNLGVELAAMAETMSAAGYKLLSAKVDDPNLVAFGEAHHFMQISKHATYEVDIRLHDSLSRY